MRLRALAALVPLMFGYYSSPASAVPLTPRMDVWVKSRTTTSLYVCARAYVDDPGFVTGAWFYMPAGAGLSRVPAVSTGASFSEACLTVDGSAAPAGAGIVHLAFVGVSTTTGDVVGDCAMTYAWVPTFPINGLNGWCTDAT